MFFNAAPHEVRTAFEVLGNARRLAAIFDAFLGMPCWPTPVVQEKITHAVIEDIRTQQHLITHDVNEHMTRYEVRTFRGIRSI